MGIKIGDVTARFVRSFDTSFLEISVFIRLLENYGTPSMFSPTFLAQQHTQ